MSTQINSYLDFVLGLDATQFDLLCDAIKQRKDRERYVATSFEEAALNYGRKPICPKCLSDKYQEDGYTPSLAKRYKCENCECSYTLLSDSIFNSSKISFHKLMSYIQLMSFNVPLELMCEVLDIASNTAELWRKKIFSTVDNYQNHLRLYNRVKICIVVAIDSSKNMLAIICGHGKPSSKRVYAALKDHVIPGSTIIHDGDNSHKYLIDALNLKSEVYIANTKDSEYIKNMAMINNMCSWLKRYIWRFIGMEVVNLQSYLNWFIYLHRCKRDNEK